jgi:hypothetical protein
MPALGRIFFRAVDDVLSAVLTNETFHVSPLLKNKTPGEEQADSRLTLQRASKFPTGWVFFSNRSNRLLFSVLVLDQVFFLLLDIALAETALAHVECQAYFTGKTLF